MTKENAHDLARSFGYLSQQEVTALKQLTMLLPENPTIINIGAGAGTSGTAFLETRPDVTLHTIDIRKEASPLGSLQSEINALDKAEIDYKHRHHQYHGDSKEILPTLNFKADMIFIDGDHSREGIFGDIECATDVLKPGGIMVFDDYGENENGENRWPAVKNVVDEIVAPYHEEVLYVHSIIAFRVA